MTKYNFSIKFKFKNKKSNLMSHNKYLCKKNN